VKPLSRAESLRAQRTPEEQRAVDRRLNRPLLVVATTGLLVGAFALAVSLNQWAERVKPFVLSVRPQGRPSTGDPAAHNTIVLYTDFRCPYCQKFDADTLPTLKAMLPDVDARLVYLNRFLFGSGSVRAGMAAECAFRQGGQPAYDRMSTLLYQEGRQHSEQDAAAPDDRDGRPGRVVGRVVPFVYRGPLGGP